jgi:predicted secreted acid phosphatase
VVEDNYAREGGGAVFFVSNDRTGTMRIEDSTLRHNVSDGFETQGFPGIFFLGAKNPTVTGSTLRK